MGIHVTHISPDDGFHARGSYDDNYMPDMAEEMDDEILGEYGRGDHPIIWGD